MAETFMVEFDGELLRRGSSLYVLEATTPDSAKLLYVGMTKAQSLFERLAGNVGRHPTLSRARSCLEQRGVDPITCQFRMVGYGPLITGATEQKPKPQLAALEKKLAEDLTAAGYDVMNDVHSNALVDEELYKQVRDALAVQFPGL
jgi:hypothetical protein